jgi:hypothetical protein
VPELTDRIWANYLQAWGRRTRSPILESFALTTEEILHKYTEGYTGKRRLLALLAAEEDDGDE